MALTERLAVIIDAHSGGAVREFDKATAASGKFTKQSQQQTVTIGKLNFTHEQLAHGLRAGVASAAVAGAYALARFGKAAYAEARDAAKIGRMTEAVLKSTGSAANVTAGDVADLAEALSLKAGVDDEVIQSGENVLLTFTKVRNEVGAGNDVFDQATTLALDMSVALGKDLQGSIVMVGKALNDPIKGITALSRAGVSFTEQQKEQITTLVESGRTLEAQKMILGELGTEFRGAAAAAADPAAKLTVAWQNFEEEVGTALLPAINGITEGLTDVASAAQFVAGNSTLRRLVLTIGGVATALYAANKAIKIYKAIQGAELIQILTRAAIGHGAVATATTAEAAAAGTATVAVEGLAAAETAATVAGVGLLAKLGALAAKVAQFPVVGINSLQTPDAGDNVTQLLNDALAAGKDLHQVIADINDMGFDPFKNGDDLTTEQIDELRKKYGLTATAADNLTGAEQDLTGAHKDAADAAKEAAEREQELLDARIASFNSNIAYKRSELDVKDALLAVKEAADSGTHEEYTKAVLDAKDAMLGEAAAAVQLAQDQAEANGKTLSAQQASRIYRGELRELAGNLAPGSPLRKYLRGLIHDLDEASKDRHTTLTYAVKGYNVPGTQHDGVFVPKGAATGGPIYGPGTGTSDSIPMMLSNGEYVIRADGSNLRDALNFYAATSPTAVRSADLTLNKADASRPPVHIVVNNPVPERAAVSVPRALRETAYVEGFAW